MLSQQSTSGSESKPRPPPNRRRDKAQLSCNLCRRRKLRCDRQQPCQTCAHRGLQCTYVNSGPVSAGVTQNAATSRPRPNLQARLTQLENLVVSMMDGSTSSHGTSLTDDQSGSSSTNPNPTVLESVESVAHGGTDEDSKNSEGGSILGNASESRYVGSGHWASILDGIAELREHLEAEEETQRSSATPGSLGPPAQDDEMPLLYSCRPASKAEILASIPPKLILDRYISYYFNAMDLSSAAVHTTKFQREYENFWQSPSEVPVMWLGLLYSIMGMAVISSEATRALEGEDPKILIDQYREKTAQCLLLGRYTNGGPYTWETLYQYVMIELSTRMDGTQAIGILHGISMNLIMQMGYHRDPSHFPSISPFQGELRRRSWVKSLEGDLLMAMQTGIPRRITDGQWDTKEPRNLNDSDFDEDTIELPPGRPETEVTTVLHLIARRRMMVAVGAAVDLATSVKPPAYSEVMAVDQQIRESEASLPAPLKMKSLLASVTEHPQLIIQRFYVALMFRMGEVMLHRRYLSLDKDTEGFASSRKTCLDACLSILKIQQTLDEETAVGGVLHSVGVKMWSLGNHGFLTACMTLCVVVHKGLHTPGNEHALAREDDIKTALKTSLSAWRQRGPSSREARIAAESVRLVLKRSGWLDESPATSDLSYSQGDGVDVGSYEGFLGSGENLGEFSSAMFGSDLDMEGFPWFMDPLSSGMSVDDGQSMPHDPNLLE